MRCLRLIVFIVPLFLYSCLGRQENHLVERVVVGGDYSLLQNRIQRKELRGASKRDLSFIRNTLYAKYGKNFKDPELKHHFERFAWYRPTGDDSSIHLNEVEKQNESLLLDLEENPGRTGEATISEKHG